MWFPLTTVIEKKVKTAEFTLNVIFKKIAYMQNDIGA